MKVSTKPFFSSFFALLIIYPGITAIGQINSNQLSGANRNTIQTSVPFLTIAPDARSAGMGDIGAATAPDLNSQYWNVAKYGFMDKRSGASISYTPWERNLIPGINLAYFSGYFKLDKNNILSSSLRYFSLGEIVFTNLSGMPVSSYHPREFAVDAGYTRLFSERFSGGIVLRYIHSDLTRGQTTASGQETSPGRSIAGDLGLFYQDDVSIGERSALWAIGVNISNVGSPISYTADAQKTPIPTNLRIGSSFTLNINESHSISLAGDANKLMVPTSAVYGTDSITGDPVVIRGYYPPESVLMGMFQSFYDAPGIDRGDGSYSVIGEELNEINFGIGFEYWYDHLIAVRTGYFHESQSKGNREYFTFGLGISNRIITLDLSYLRSTKGQHSPMDQTIRLTLSSRIGSIITTSDYL